MHYLRCHYNHADACIESRQSSRITRPPVTWIKVLHSSRKKLPLFILHTSVLLEDVAPFVTMTLYSGVHGIWRSFIASEICPGGEAKWDLDWTLDSRRMHGPWWRGVTWCISTHHLPTVMWKSKYWKYWLLNVHVCIPLKAKSSVIQQSFGN